MGSGMCNRIRFLAAVCFCFGMLLQSAPVRANDAPLLLRYGSSFGECLGYCSRHMEVFADHVVFRANKYGDDERPAAVRSEARLSQREQDELLHLLASTSIDGLDKTIGCPDCNDGGAEWIEIAVGGQASRRITFEYHHAPAQLARITKWLGALQARFPIPAPP